MKSKSPKKTEFSFMQKCQGSNHVWLWIGEHLMDDSPPSNDQKCVCGKMTWKEFTTLKDDPRTTPS